MRFESHGPAPIRKLRFMGNKEVLAEETIDLFFVFRDNHLINLYFESRITFIELLFSTMQLAIILRTL